MTLEEALRASSANNRLPCAEAFKIASGLKIPRKQVGDMVNQLKIRIINCQLGCFQFEKATHAGLDTIPLNNILADEIKASLVNSYLPCPVAFKIARKLQITPREVGDATTKQKVKIVNCQLGCF